MLYHNKRPMKLSILVFLSALHWIYAEVNYYYTNVSMGYNEAVNYCKGKHMSLVRIDNEWQNMQVHNFTRNINSGVFWIEGTDVVDETKWVNSDHVELQYKNWAHSEPNGGRNENCIAGNLFGQPDWYDMNCGNEYSVICQFSGGGFTKHLYRISPHSMDYHAAIRYCDNLGMDLVVINNATENMVVANIARFHGFHNFWINGNDQARETFWMDSYNDRLPFANWKHHHPNGGRYKNCAQGSNDGIWRDANCNEYYRAICGPEKNSFRKQHFGHLHMYTNYPYYGSYYNTTTSPYHGTQYYTHIPNYLSHHHSSSPYMGFESRNYFFGTNYNVNRDAESTCRGMNMKKFIMSNDTFQSYEHLQQWKNILTNNFTNFDYWVDTTDDLRFSGYITLQSHPGPGYCPFVYTYLPYIVGWAHCSSHHGTICSAIGPHVRG